MFLYRHWCRGRMICCMSDGVISFVSCLPHSNIHRDGLEGGDDW